ncbi:hypothetical protein MUK42_34140 [Musa troglodytarum]|uniref:Uncharacterized protein n=1 Tax=Musa troglodytarum TaxID=320322 RepID=A0A9E7KT69_9LILI|nr:hypothetical protein MUK42_34140 [Musa troglodytarum]
MKAKTKVVEKEKTKAWPFDWTVLLVTTRRPPDEIAATPSRVKLSAPSTEAASFWWRKRRRTEALRSPADIFVFKNLEQILVLDGQRRELALVSHSQHIRKLVGNPLIAAMMSKHRDGRAYSAERTWNDAEGTPLMVETAANGRKTIQEIDTLMP